MDFLLNMFLGVFEIAFTQHPWQTGLFTLVFMGIAYLLVGSKNISNLRFVAVDHFIVKEQMKFSEELADRLEDSLIALFLRLRKEAKGTKVGLMDDEETKRFQLLMKYLKKKALKLLRHSFRENHLTERENYEQWMDMRAEEILRNMREHLNNWYERNVDPSLEYFYDKYTVEKRPELKEGIKSALREAREISLRFAKKKYVKKYIKSISKNVRG